MSHSEAIPDLYSAALHLYEVYPTYDEFDVREIVEEKSGRRVTDEDFQTLKAVYVRVQLHRAEFGEGVAEPGLDD
jgi:CRISPR/Cas system endoribonuclease Cas6 (RAMP superfamily)